MLILTLHHGTALMHPIACIHYWGMHPKAASLCKIVLLPYDPLNTHQIYEQTWKIDIEIKDKFERGHALRLKTQLNG
jgi:hypothetical protein